MGRTLLGLISIGAAAVFSAAGQQTAPPPQPPLLACGTQGTAEILCGTRSPEDLEVTPDGKFLIVSQMVNRRGGTGPVEGAGLVLFDLARKTFSKMPVSVDARAGWGDPACPGPVGASLVPHGISLTKRTNGAMQLYVVNHGGRESIEMFELRKEAATWALVWHGCVVSMHDFNDVAALPDGNFIATHPTSLRVAGDTSDLFSGKPTGWVAQWSAGKGETELPGTQAGYPNGVLASADGRTVYFNAWTAKEVHKYDLKTEKETGVVKLDFLPDNITWTSRGRILAAGVKGTRGNCPPAGAAPCIQGFEIAEVGPAQWQSRTIFDSQGKGALISGVSVALAVKKSIYVGAFQGDRIVRVEKP